MRRIDWCLALLAACCCSTAAAAPAASAAARDLPPTAASRAPIAPATSAREAVAAAERAFARSMAERDLTAFASFVAEDAVFFSGPREVLRGRAAVVAGWARWFTAPVAPFSWAPDEVEVLESGTLAHSSGPVLDPAGKTVGRFNSIWRREADGHWRVVFDKGERVCECSAAAAR